MLIAVVSLLTLMSNFDLHAFQLGETDPQQVVFAQSYRNFQFCILRDRDLNIGKSPDWFVPMLVSPTGEQSSMGGSASQAGTIAHAKHWIDQQILLSQLQHGTVTLLIDQTNQSAQKLQFTVNGERIEPGQERSILKALKALIQNPFI